jgi:hypothetical protein
MSKKLSEIISRELFINSGTSGPSDIIYAAPLFNQEGWTEVSYGNDMALGIPVIVTTVLQQWGNQNSDVNINGVFTSANSTVSIIQNASHSGVITSIQVAFYNAPTSTTGFKVKIFSVVSDQTMSMVSEQLVSVSPVTGWQTITLSQPMPIAAGQRVGFYFSSGAIGYTATASFSSLSQAGDITTNATFHSSSFTIALRATIHATIYNANIPVAGAFTSDGGYMQFQRSGSVTEEPVGMVKMVDTAIIDPQWMQIADNISRLKSELGAAADFFTPDLSVVTRTVPNHDWQAIATHNGLSIAIAAGTNQYITSTDNFATHTLRTLPITVRASGANPAQICVNDNGTFMALLNDNAATNTWRKYLTTDGVNWTTQENWITGGSGSHDFAEGGVIGSGGTLFYRLITYAISSTVRGFRLEVSEHGGVWTTVESVEVTPNTATPSKVLCWNNNVYWITPHSVLLNEKRLRKNDSVIFSFYSDTLSLSGNSFLEKDKNMFLINRYFSSYWQYNSLINATSSNRVSASSDLFSMLCSNKKMALSCDQNHIDNRVTTHPVHWHLSSAADTRINSGSMNAFYADRNSSVFSAIGKVSNTQFKHITESPTHVITSVPYWVDLPAGKKWVVKISE